MAITTRWMGPGFDLVSGAHPMDRLFEQFFGYGSRTEEGGVPTHALPIDIVETEDAYQLYATVAGVPEDGVEVTFEDGRKGTISARVKIRDMKTEPAAGTIGKAA